jgi:UDP-glucose 4-epimerase
MLDLEHDPSSSGVLSEGLTGSERETDDFSATFCFSKHLMTKRILVTGGSGFIGTHLCRALVQAGHSVRVLDLNVSAQAQAVLGVEYRQGDVRDRKSVVSAVQDVQAVYHLAAIAGVPLCQAEPFESTQTNLASTALVMENLKPGTRFVYSGSSAVYGDSGREGEALSETREIKDLISFYAVQKHACEGLIRQFRLSRGIPSVVFRFFNVFGPGQDPKSSYTGVITAFSEAIRAGRPIRLNGGGVQTRDFVSVHDIVRGLLLAIECPDENCNAEPINLGTGTPVTIRKLAELMREISGSSVPLEEAPWREGDVRHSSAQIDRAAQQLGWKPLISLKTGLAELIQ